MGFFGRRPPIDRDEWEWQLASFKWLIQEFGGIEDNPGNQLVLPTADFIAPTSDVPEERALQIFERVKELCGMKDWPTTLRQGEQRLPDSVAAGISLVHESGPPAGEYRLIESEDGIASAEIFYNPSHIKQPVNLIATFAHELGHFLMSGAKTPPPGGWEIHELTTDLAAVYLGFGIFLANSASSFSAFSEFDQIGWQHDIQGYLSADALVSALAIWESLAERDPTLASPHLKKNLRKQLKRTTKYLRNQDVEKDVMGMDLSDYAN